MSTPILERPADAGRHPGPHGDHAGSNNRPGFRFDIQGLRAVAVLLVVLFHAGVPGLDGGYVGVDVFFVISGFLITGLIRNEMTRTGRLRFGRFYARRARRLLPSASVVLIVTVLMAWAWGPALQLRTTALDAAFSAFYAINFRLAARGVDYQNAAGPESPLQHFWSLAVEEQFYLIWPLLLVVAVALLPRFRAAAILAAVTVVTGLSLWYSVHLTEVAAPQAYFSVFTRGWEFGIGAIVVLSMTVLDRVPALLRDVLGWIGLAAIVGSAVVFGAATPFPGDAALVPVLGAAAVLGCGQTSGRGPVALLRHRPFQLVGTVSYGWYLWHWPLLLLLPSAFGTPFGWLRNLEVCVLALWLAGITYLLFETLANKPMPHPRSWLARGALTSAAAAALAVVVAVGFSDVPLSGRPATPLASSPGDTALSAALDASATVSAVPSNLTPTLARAANDRPASTFDGCYLDYLETANLPCVSGDTSSTQTVVLFGDSHAQQWQAALEQVATAQKFRLVTWTKAACPVADITVVNETLQREYSECDAWRAATVAAIKAMQPTLVVTSQSETVPPQSLAASTWALATARTIQQFMSSDTRVAYLADIPTPTADVPSCLADHLGDATACGFPRSDAYSAGGDHADKHRTTASVLSNVGVQVIDPINWMCTASVCPPFSANQLIYRDSRHLTNTYGATLGPVLNSVLHVN